MSKKSLSLCSRGTGNDRFTDMVVVFTIYGAHVGVYSSYMHCADCFKSKVHFWPSNNPLCPVLTMQLQNQTSAAIQLSKPVIFGHRGGFDGGFGDVDATWRWGPPVSPPLSSLSSLLSLFSPLPLLSPCAGRPPPSVSLHPSPLSPQAGGGLPLASLPGGPSRTGLLPPGRLSSSCTGLPPPTPAFLLPGCHRQRGRRGLVRPRRPPPMLSASAGVGARRRRGGAG